MRPIDVLNAPWAIMPEKLTQIQGIYLAHLRGPKIKEETIKAIEADMGRPLQNKDQGYQVVNGTAIIPVQGVIAKRMNLFTRISGGASTELISRDFLSALDDSSVRSIVFDIDSPGGTVDGTQNLSTLIYENRGKKPVIAFCDGMMASAAYWIGSAADQVVISNDTVELGSIGVVASHVDVSKSEEMWGVKTTEITAGKYKRIASQYSPLSKEGRAYIQEQVDYLYSAFVGDVARNRGMSEEEVISRMADGKIFIGNQAIEAGLADRVSTMDGLISELAAREAAGFAAADTNDKEELMNKEELKAKHPDLFKAVFDEGFAEGQKKGQDQMECPEHCVEKAEKEGAAAEAARIKGVYEVGKSRQARGHADLIESMLFDGKATADSARAAIFDAQEGKLSRQREDYLADGKDVKVPVTDGTAADAGKAKEAAQDADADLPVEERAKKAWDADGKLRTEFGGDYASFKAYFEATDNGQVKIMQKKGD